MDEDCNEEQSPRDGRTIRLNSKRGTMTLEQFELIRVLEVSAECE